MELANCQVRGYQVLFLYCRERFTLLANHAKSVFAFVLLSACEEIRTLSISGMSLRSAFSQITGTRSGYLARMRSASDFRFSVSIVNKRGRKIVRSQTKPCFTIHDLNEGMGAKEFDLSAAQCTPRQLRGKNEKVKIWIPLEEFSPRESSMTELELLSLAASSPSPRSRHNI